jgi:cbb3-type cytochrome oxidase maturation protein
MCPNCILNQMGMASGLYVAFGICALFFVVGLAVMWWAFKDGQFEDIESAKYEMMSDEPGTSAGATNHGGA